MKKLLTTAIALAMAASFTLGVAACGRKDEGGTDEDHTHSFTWVYNDDATCTEDGTETERCTCGETGETRTKTGTKLGHDIKLLPAKKATCSESGYSAHNGCTRCGYTTDNVTYTDALHVQYELNEAGVGYTVVVVNDACQDLAIEIPYYYKGLPVTAIGEYAFYSCYGLESVTIPDSVKTIGKLAFSYLQSLESIVIPKGVISIGEGAFVDSAIKSITLPDSVTEIGQRAFNSCYNLKTATLPKNLTKIEDFLFYECWVLTSVTMPEAVTTIGNGAFSACSSLTSIVIPKNVTDIGEFAFNFCIDLLEVWNFSALPIEKGAESFGSVALNAKYVYTTNEKGRQILTDDGFLFFEDEEESWLLHCIGHETSLALPALSPTGKPYRMYSGVFQYDRLLKQVVLPEGMTAIGEEAFFGCQLLESVTIPDSVTTIGEGAFNGCFSIINIIIPKSVTLIEFGAFTNTSLGFVLYEGTPTDWDKIEVAEKNFEDSIHPVTIYYFSENEPTAEQWAESENWWHYDEETGEPTPWVKEEQ